MSGGASPIPLGLLTAILFLHLHSLPTVQSQIIATITSFNKTYDVYNYSFSNFSKAGVNPTLKIFKDAQDSLSGALQLTPETSNDAAQFLVNKSGSVLLTHRFTLWKQKSSSHIPNATEKYVASFNTSFTVNILRLRNDTMGEGMAFFIASDLAGPPPGSEGRFLGLTNATLDGNPGNRFVAIELDTFKETEVNDSNGNHIALDINSVKSNRTADLPFEIALASNANYTVWVDYDGDGRHLRVYMDREHRPKPNASVLNASLDLSYYLGETGYFGFSASTGNAYQMNSLWSWDLTVERLSEEKSRMPAWKLSVIISSVVLALVAVIAFMVVELYRRRRKRRREESAVSNELLLGMLRRLPGTPREFDFKELNKATSSFDEGMKLGKGGFGEVYRGVLVLQEGNREVAVKKFFRGSSGPDDFIMELTIINRLRHKHLVPLVGWCHTNGVLLLVYDYMPNGSLDQHLFSDCPDRKPILNWERRYNVIAGVASALHYLHDKYDQRVVHRDLKASNIMLDANFNARLGDFGLARALDTDKTSYADLEMGGVPGTMGYIAPECFHTGKATRESDIFGFGAIVLEVVCGRRPKCDIGGFQFLCDWVWKLHREGRILDAVDAGLENEYDPEDARRLLLLALACSHPIPSERPVTGAIVQIVSRALPLPEVPIAKPSFVWPSGDPEVAPELTLSQLTTSSAAVTCSSYTPTPGWIPQHLSREGHVGPRN